MPKTIFFRRRYFDSAIWFRGVAQIQAAKCGLGATDALHISAAYLADADEFVTT